MHVEGGDHVEVEDVAQVAGDHDERGWGSCGRGGRCCTGGGGCRLVVPHNLYNPWTSPQQFQYPHIHLEHTKRLNMSDDAFPGQQGERIFHLVL